MWQMCGLNAIRAEVVNLGKSTSWRGENDNELAPMCAHGSHAPAEAEVNPCVRHDDEWSRRMIVRVGYSVYSIPIPTRYDRYNHTHARTPRTPVAA